MAMVWPLPFNPHHIFAAKFLAVLQVTLHPFFSIPSPQQGFLPHSLNLPDTEDLSLELCLQGLKCGYKSSNPCAINELKKTFVTVPNFFVTAPPWQHPWFSCRPPPHISWWHGSGLNSKSFCLLWAIPGEYLHLPVGLLWLCAHTGVSASCISHGPLAPGQVNRTEF